MSDRLKKGKAGFADVAIGGCLRQKRLERKISQQELAYAIGVTFQQVQKYESGKNRISASKLYMIAHVLDVDITDFFTKETREDIQRNVPSVKNHDTLKDALKAFEQEKTINSL